ncbi:acetyltransferase [Christiangramia sp.]|uniref:acetyltransferase n=1 Tax=Christiangramia sp. TaxID=1931228 RepID=UPI00261ACEA7|nr:acetyltransferase [Christiangramia sp.]
MIVYGGSGHAKVILDIINSKDGESVTFIFDDDKSIKTLYEFKVNHNWTEEMLNQKAVIAIGNNLTRKKVSDKIQNLFIEALIHRSAVISEEVKIDNGSVVMANAVINSSTKVGAHCIINTGAIVEHDVIIEDYVHISPSATITGNVTIGEGTHVGAGATVIPGVEVGKWVTVGAGAVIINDIPDFSVVVGNPGKVIKFNNIENE